MVTIRAGESMLSAVSAGSSEGVSRGRIEGCDSAGASARVGTDQSERIACCALAAASLFCLRRATERIRAASSRIEAGLVR